MTRIPNSPDFGRRLTPPGHLIKPEAKVFRSVVAAVASDHFQVCDVPLLVEFARATCLADQAAAALAAEGIVVNGKVSGWVAVQEKAQRGLVALSARLRICPQSRFDRTKAGVTARTGLPDGYAQDDDDLLARPLTGLASFRKPIRRS